MFFGYRFFLQNIFKHFFHTFESKFFRLSLFLQAFKIRSCILNSQMPANYRYHIVQEFNEGKYPYIIASDTNDLIHEGEAENEEPKKKKVRILIHFYFYYCHVYLSMHRFKIDFCA